jgi:hypothetical protein
LQLLLPMPRGFTAMERRQEQQLDDVLGGPRNRKKLSVLSCSMHALSQCANRLLPPLPSLSDPIIT